MLRDWVRDHYNLKLLSNSESGRALVLRVKPIRPYPLRHIAVCKFIVFFLHRRCLPNSQTSLFIAIVPLIY